MNIGTSRRCGPSIGEKRCFFLVCAQCCRSLGIFFFGAPWYALDHMLEFETSSIYQFESARKLLAEPGAGTSARSLFWSCFSERHFFELSQVQISFNLGRLGYETCIAKGVK